MAIQLIVKHSKSEGDESLKFEIYDLGERYCYKLPEGTSFEALLDMFESGAEYYEEDRDEWEVEKLGEEGYWDWSDDDDFDDDVGEREKHVIVITADSVQRCISEDCILLGDDDCMIVEKS